MHPARGVLVTIAYVGLVNCGGGADVRGGMASGTARIVHGPGSAQSVMGRVQGIAAATDGEWRLSPDSGQAKVLAISFTSATQGHSWEASFGDDCVPTYDRADEALSPMLDCSFEVPEGSYVGIGLAMSKTVQVRIDDPTNGIFTDLESPTKLSAAEPIGGAHLVDVTPPIDQEALRFGYALTEPLVIEAGDTVTLTVVADMTHTVYAVAEAGVMRFEDRFSYAPMYLFATVGTVGATGYYASVATAENYNRSTLGSEAGGPKGETSLRLFYGADSQPAYIFLDHFAGNSGGDACHSSSSMGGAAAADPATSPAQNEAGDRAGGYLGRDVDGTVCWAFGTNTRWESYDSFFSIPDTDTIGTTTTLSCEQIAAATVPTAGSTYASGCPAITANVTAGVTLLAN